MGHQLLGKLPATRKWEAVVRLVAGGAEVDEVAAAAADAAEASLVAAADDPALRRAFHLLVCVPLAAREEAYGQALCRLGLQVGETPTLIEVGVAIAAAADRASDPSDSHTDLGEMATLAAVESLIALASREGPSLFGATYAADEARAAFRVLSTDRGFAALARDFFARLTRRCLDYFLSRAVAGHVGTNRRFPSLKDHHAFDAAMALHCREVSEIIEAFAEGWHGKALYEGGITTAKSCNFLHIAFTKVRDELRTRRRRLVVYG